MPKTGKVKKIVGALMGALVCAVVCTFMGVPVVWPELCATNVSCEPQNQLQEPLDSSGPNIRAGCPRVSPKKGCSRVGGWGFIFLSARY